MKSALIPEKPLLVYPSLAATVGLEEALMLSALSDLIRNEAGHPNNGFLWYRLSLQVLTDTLPFWDSRDFHRVATNLREKGILLIASAGYEDGEFFKFAFNEKHQLSTKQPKVNSSAPNTTAPNTSASNTPTNHSMHYNSPQSRNNNFPSPAFSTNQPEGGKNYIGDHWRPDETTLAQLAQLNVPNNFALEQVPEFVTYWRERGEAHRSWGQKFISHTIQRWRTFEAREHRKSKATPIHAHWAPSENCMSELLGKGIRRDFILDQVTEFIHYWRDLGEKHVSWDAKFIQRVLAEWAKRESQKNIATKEFKIENHWRPSPDAMEVMSVKSGIPLGFIEDAIPEFIIYWKDKGLATTTWNSLFIKHVRLQWHRFQHASQHTTEAQTIPVDWQPNEDVYDILRMANIDPEFARALLAEFVMYWRDSNQIHNSWNTRFIRHVKKTWAQRHALTNADSSTMSTAAKSTRDVSLEELLTDQSWAE